MPDGPCLTRSDEVFKLTQCVAHGAVCSVTRSQMRRDMRKFSHKIFSLSPAAPVFASRSARSGRDTA
ncbi:hypothetical protein SXCC_01637 [Gluconacetobacter sp. SXCC-1]|nr:hypothetical protein SXCC_01637 [Gluconacetobacter sp. SXCC-1]